MCVTHVGSLYIGDEFTGSSTTNLLQFFSDLKRYINLKMIKKRVLGKTNLFFALHLYQYLYSILLTGMYLFRLNDLLQ